MSLYEGSVPQLKQMLVNLDKWLEVAVAHAQKKSFDPNVLGSARLAPDQYPLTRQVQAACDAAKFAASRLTGKEPPKHPDTETTIDELRARVKTVVAYLDTFTKADFEGAEKRDIALPFMQGKAMTGADYLNQMVLPNFYFHVTHVYAILRHNGVALGKMDYIGNLSLHDA
jgi:uncharacterized protein